MSVSAPDPVLQAIVRSAVESTGAAEGWVLAIGDGSLRVVAAAGPGSGDAFGRDVEMAGAEGYVASSGQPLALSSRGGDSRLQEGLAQLLGRAPASLLCVPCGDDETMLGVLELLDKQNGDSFTFDDVELATLLGGLAGVALVRSSEGAGVPSPSELHGDLMRLAEVDPQRYATVATVFAALLGRG